MTKITHIIDALPESEHFVKLLRREDLFLTAPPPSVMKLWRDHESLAVTHFAQEWKPAKFAPPRDIFSCDSLRLEWQQMDNRQPFYHRNADVDEISYQVSGERTLMTELGTVELRTGDFSRIPVGIAHDNWGRKEIHLLFYVIANAVDMGPVVGKAEIKQSPFEGWKPNSSAIEMITECLGAKGCDISVSHVDEDLLLHGSLQESTDSDTKLVIQRPTAKDSEAEWLYKSARVWIGNVHLNVTKGETYRSHRRATAVHCQISGTRTLVSQRGTVELQPGDFVSIPRGSGYTSICKEESSYILILAADDVALKSEITKKAETSSVGSVAEIRASF
ncbi:hypothetical protein NW762_006258 [Fusarium torreyae]|uniref:Uncharacterized protein n=1 Tax=Fusarium torreyae TaxID=1237075 RepID=A0A9W8S161_9HYPO|nr:hypothetical protein NW762_006258 [Fusarium torreyae]